MMTGFRKSRLTLILVLGLSLGLALSAWAGPKGKGGGHGMGMWEDCCPMGPGMGMGMQHGRGMGGMQLTPDQAAKVFDLRHKFMNDTAELRKQMMVKRAELGELWRTKDPDQAKIAAKQKEINALRDQLQEKGLALKMDMRQICPMMGEGPPWTRSQGPPAPAGEKK
ncbi:MAG: periplasmic heavy metal sensor [Deltaproteobacteria bacterium]|nr:periplasmic heavy metal sensor [Deltaproteobacteria bacterium]